MKVSCEKDFFSKKGKIYRAQFKKNNDSFFFLEQTRSNISNTNYFQNELEKCRKMQRRDVRRSLHQVDWSELESHLHCARF